MSKNIFLLTTILLLCTATAFTQVSNANDTVPAQATEAYIPYLNKNLRYPVDARENEISGKVIVGFIVEADGSIAHCTIIEGAELKGGLAEEALRVVQSMPHWQPATVNGKPIRSMAQTPISFTLMNKKERKKKKQ